jgi:hypothetical protein
MRAYSVAVATLALDAEAKWLDNVLSHHSIAGVEKNRQGIQRRIPPDALLVLAIARTLIIDLNMPIASAIRLAQRVHESRSPVDISDSITVAVDVARIARELNGRLADAVEGAAQRQRGRPTPSRSASRGAG